MRSPRNLLALFFLTLFLATPSLPARAEATAASAVVRDFYDALTDTMKQGEALGFAGRYKKLQPAIEKSFNLPLMTRIAVGSAWRMAQPEAQREVVTAFTGFSIATYASRFVKYDGEQFAVLGEKTASGGGVIVETTLTPKGEEAVALNYLVRIDDEGKPRIVDVFLNATISELATRRAEFSAVVNRDGFAALAAMLNEKAKKMGAS